MRTRIIASLVFAFSSVASCRRAPAAPEGKLAAVALYRCGAGRTIAAAFYDGDAKPPRVAGGPAMPGGSVRLALSDGRSMALAQTLSADGARYAGPAESFVFWSKGDGALVLEGGREKDFTGCAVASPQKAK